LLVAGVFVSLGPSLFACVPLGCDWTPFAFICAVGGSFYFLAVRLSPGIQLIPEGAGAALQESASPKTRAPRCKKAPLR
jgi:hypothetical protein